MRELAGDDVPVTVSCRVLGLCRQQYYRWRANPITDSEWDNAHLSNAILAAHDEDPQYGSESFAHSMSAVSMPMVSSRAAKFWRTRSASSRFAVTQTMPTLAPGRA
nr:hypothetical protein [Aeromicrobium sp.]